MSVVIIVIVKEPSMMTFLKASVGMWHKSVTGKRGGYLGEKGSFGKEGLYSFF